MADQIKLLNYNTWHGLNGQGVRHFGELEPAARRQKRYALQISLFKELDNDFIFLQEVNPLYARAREIATALRMDFVAQHDQAGIKIAGQGLPDNLQSGLVILAKPKFKLKKIAGVKLSGKTGFCSEYLSIQTSEFRYALVAEVYIEKLRVELVNTHFHHGPVPSGELLDQLDRSFVTEKTSRAHKDEILKAIESGTERRAQEMKRLVPYVATGPRILCGDLNVEESDGLLQNLKNLGLKDVFASTGVLSWDSKRNVENHELTKELVLPVPTFGSASLTRIFKEYDARPRRIDYIWVSPDFTALHPTLVMNEAREGLIASDHFGLSTTLTIKGMKKNEDRKRN